MKINRYKFSEKKCKLSLLFKNSKDKHSIEISARPLKVFDGFKKLK